MADDKGAARATGQRDNDKSPGRGRMSASELATRGAERLGNSADFPDNVDPRLDNRGGRQRPPLASWPAAPQQIDGPEIGREAEYLDALPPVSETPEGPTTGMFAPGPHGLSDESTRLPSGTRGTEGETPSEALTQATGDGGDKATADKAAKVSHGGTNKGSGDGA